MCMLMRIKTIAELSINMKKEDKEKLKEELEEYMNEDAVVGEDCICIEDEDCFNINTDEYLKEDLTEIYEKYKDKGLLNIRILIWYMEEPNEEINILDEVEKVRG